MIVAGVVASITMGGAAAAHAESAAWVTLKIARVQVKPAKIDGSQWDQPTEKNASGCGLIGLAGNLVASPVVGAIATHLCSQSSQPQQGRNPTAPDLFVQVSTGDVQYRTPVALDTFAEVFDFPVLVPLDGIPATGLQVQVLDQDQDVGAGELIGMVRVTRRQLQEALSADTPLLTLSDSQLDKLEIEVSRYSEPVPTNKLSFNAKSEPVAIPVRVRAGELVMISARGSYSVASDHTQKIDENGYTGGEKRSYNQSDFEKVNHGAAVAYIGAPKESHAALVVGSCVIAVAPLAGQLYIGINDSDVSNNQGTLEFNVQTQAPTLEQWRAGGGATCQGRSRPSSAAAPPAPAGAAAQPETLDRAMISESIERVKSDVLACGSKVAARGQVKVSVVVGTGGAVTSVSIVSAPDVALGECVAAAMKRAAFPPTRTGGSFSYPFVF